MNPANKRKRGTQPNIIFILSDQQRWDTLGCYGQKLPVTPNLDKMAAEGVRFEHAFTCQPVCGPARACLQTGKYATEIGCYRNNKALPLDEKTLAHYLREAGYDVGYIGKWHLASESSKLDRIDPNEEGAADYHTTAIPPERRGGYNDFWIVADTLEFTSHSYGGYLFDQNMQKVEFTGYRVDALTDFALDFLRSCNEEEPFFLFLSYLEPHHQNSHNRYEGPKGSQERFKDFEAPGDLADCQGQGDWEANYPDYLGCCASIDENVGRIRDELEKLGFAENTVIIYSSDHGSHFRTRNTEIQGKDDGDFYDGYKRCCHEAAIRLPLIIYGPGFKGGKVISELVSLIDYPSTILTCAGVEKPAVMRGRPLQELVNGNIADWPQEVFLQISESQVGRAIRTHKWKYSVRAPGKSGVYCVESDEYLEDFLYDLENDPYEQHNLVKDPTLVDVRKELAEVLKRRMSESGELISEIQPAV